MGRVVPKDRPSIAGGGGGTNAASKPDESWNMSEAARILVVEDDDDLRNLLVEDLGQEGFRTEGVRSAEDALSAFASMEPDCVLTDLELPGQSGLDLAERLAEKSELPVILMTGHESLDNAVAAVRAGVFDFLIKPVEPRTFRLALERALRHAALSKEVRRLRDAHPEVQAEGILGDSKEITEVRRMVQRVAQADIGVLISGESGTGKELVARALHSGGPRSEGPFVAVNCAAMPAQLLESELFGHVAGAFTDARSDHQGLFQRANGGTLLLDEVGEMPMEMQPKLLRALQEEKVRPVGSSDEVPFDARIIGATNNDLEEAVEEGTFRDDLYYRLNVVGIWLPPLRSRGRDILVIAQHLLEREAFKQGRRVEGISRAAAERLLDHSWPGNIRELGNAIARAVALTEYTHITPEDLPASVKQLASTPQSASPDGELLSLEALERLHIERVLERCRWKRAEAASILGIDRRTLYRKIRRYGL